jgi:hypothetical protein
MLLNKMTAGINFQGETKKGVGFTYRDFDLVGDFKRFPGWDYSNINTAGKNVFIFLDNDHRNSSLARRCAEEMNVCVKNHLFTYLCMEGFTGFVQLRDLKLSKNNWDIASIPSYLDESLFSNPIYGVEDANLGLWSLKLVGEMDRIIKGGNIFSFYLAQKLQNKIISLAIMRGEIMAEKTLGLMDKLSLDRVALYFGRGHEIEVERVLRNNNVGWATYNSGKSKLF